MLLYCIAFRIKEVTGLVLLCPSMPLLFFQVDLEPSGKVHIVFELEGSASEGKHGKCHYHENSSV
jgi:hypothetical protein